MFIEVQFIIERCFVLETDIFKLHNPNSGYLLLDFCKEIEIHVVWKSILRYQFHLRGLFPLDSK